MLLTRARHIGSPYVFSSETGKPYLVTSVDHMHSEFRDMLRLPEDFVIHSLRPTFGSRLGESGADAFQIMRLMATRALRRANGTFILALRLWSVPLSGWT